MQSGPGPGSPPNSNGNALLKTFRLKATSSRARFSIRLEVQLHPQLNRLPRAAQAPRWQVRALRPIFNKCSETFGNGPAVPIRPTRVTARRRARWASTTGSSCATNTFCVADLAPPHALTFANRIEISFNLRNGGNSRGSV